MNATCEWLGLIHILGINAALDRLVHLIRINIAFLDAQCS